MTPAEATSSALADIDALEHIAGLVLLLNTRMSWISDVTVMGPREIDARVRLVDDIWSQLDELGVDLHLPDLRTLVAAHVAGHQTPSGADAAQSAPAGEETSVGNSAAPLPAPLGSDQPTYFEGDADRAGDQ